MIPQLEIQSNLPVAELMSGLSAFLQPLLAHLPEQRLRTVAQLAVQGILSGQSPMVTRMALGGRGAAATTWPLAKRLYRFLANERFSTRELLKGLYGIAQQTVASYAPPYLVIALDPVNLEKPYTQRLEGVSTVLKSTPPGPQGEKRLTAGYPALTAAVVNLPVPVVTYASWFSYVSADFVSEGRELYRAIRTSRALFPQSRVRFVGDAGLDDQKLFRQVALVRGEFIFRACHNRHVEVYNERLDCWEAELLDDLTATVPLTTTFKVAFTHAGHIRYDEVTVGWLRLRLPNTHPELWALVAHTPTFAHDLVLLTNVPVRTATDARTVYNDWRFRAQIEHSYRFDQEDGLQVEDVRVRTLERMRRIFILVLAAALFVSHVAHTWPQPMVLWLRQLGGKLGLETDRDGLYLLLAGIRAVLMAAATFTFALHHPFPRGGGTAVEKPVRRGGAHGHAPPQARGVTQSSRA